MKKIRKTGLLSKHYSVKVTSVNRAQAMFYQEQICYFKFQYKIVVFDNVRSAHAEQVHHTVCYICNTGITQHSPLHIFPAQRT